MYVLLFLLSTFQNPTAVEQALDNNPQVARELLESKLDQRTLDDIEAVLVPAPSLDQQEADIKAALALVKRTSEDTSKDAAVQALEAKLAAIIAQKPVVETKPEVKEK